MGRNMYRRGFLTPKKKPSFGAAFLLGVWYLRVLWLFGENGIDAPFARKDARGRIYGQGGGNLPFYFPMIYKYLRKKTA